jgi:tripartite-type tricarboxylate transporter receptor subunit TctC
MGARKRSVKHPRPHGEEARALPAPSRTMVESPCGSGILRDARAALALLRMRSANGFLETWGSMEMQFFALRFLAVAIAALSAAPVTADPVADFYRGKQVKIYIRAAPGGNYDIYSRLIGRHLVRFLPGNPSLLPVNMPGGGGLVALNYVANVAPRDGTVLTMITQSFPMDQALGLDRNLKVDLRALNWIGNMSDTSTIFFTAKSSPTRTLDDARRRETVVAATGAGSIMTQLAAVYNNTLGTRFKVIYGYPSGPDMSLALERGEVEGRSTSNPQALLGPGAGKADILARYNFLIQTGMRKLPNYGDVPLLRDLARSEEEQKIFDFISAAVSISRPIVTAPGVPPDRVAALRRAFDLAMSDPDFVREAQLQALEISPMGAEELTRLVLGMLDAPPDVRAKVAQAIEIKSAEPAKGIKPGAAVE